MSDNIHTQFHRFVPLSEKEALLGQKGAVLWMYGLSGSGKSTVAAAAERVLHDSGRFVMILDGDNFRSGLNADLGFSDHDRKENVRRIAEVASLLASQGIIVLVSVITPTQVLRKEARQVVGSLFRDVFVKASFEKCAERDPKGLYAKVKAGKITKFTGKDSSFEEPETSHPADLVIDTEAVDVMEGARLLVQLLGEIYASTN